MTAENSFAETDNLLDAMASVVGEANVLTDPGHTADYLVDWTRVYSSSALAVVTPKTTAEVAEIVKLCGSRNIAVVPQGGLTGLCGGGVPVAEHRSVVVSLKRMNAIRSLEPASSVTAMRMGAVAAGSALMAVGGAFLTMSAFNSFFFEMINGRGWICIALVVFGSWRPGKALIGAILFAAFDAYQVRLQQVTGGVIPYQIFLMLPYVLSILALIVVARRATYPKALMVPYQKGER